MSDNDSNESSPLLNKVSEDETQIPKEIPRKHFKGESTTLRNPYVVNTQVIPHNASHEDLRNLAQYNRYRYYSKIHNVPGGEKLVIPDHALPRILFWPYVAAQQNKQNSIITIFAIWNTMMGTSLLSLPWALQQSGFALGIILLFVMALICFYTCYLIIQSTKSIEKKDSIEFVDICEIYLGPLGKYVSLIVGVAAFVGAVVVYWVLMSNFLYKVGKFAHVHGTGTSSGSSNDSNIMLTSVHQVLCKSLDQHINKSHPHVISPGTKNSFYTYWDQQKTVPFYLVALLLPLSCFKSPTFFTKFNSLGTFSVLYLLVFVVVKASQWGPHLHFNVPKYEAPSVLFSMNFPALTGILALALYIHNAIMSILATNAKPQNNVRDVGVAYILTASTYLFVAVVFYVCFPLDKDCIEQVFLDNFLSTDIMTFIAHCGLLFQMTTVFPLLMYIVRVQVLGAIFNSTTYSYTKIIIHNIPFISLGVMMAVLYPNVGHIIRYVGSISGMIYIFTLPSLVFVAINFKTKAQRQKNRLKTGLYFILHSILILLGVSNLVAQFFVKE
ncbi:neutral amino acid transporter 9-like [Hydractinia symbiolongicarpus]|uniref:neutral amino acid transporter 9-like n=1 Tax=Hydractinia symbiolongicarpus TaxID=13093 RepID=UPI00254DBCE5|nr:neutral amino acid transporter 9-like [Hydractinia symbiolongicarpus]